MEVEDVGIGRTGRISPALLLVFILNRTKFKLLEVFYESGDRNRLLVPVCSVLMVKRKASAAISALVSVGYSSTVPTTLLRRTRFPLSSVSPNGRSSNPGFPYALRDPVFLVDIVSVET
jgi:hypothetical protein